MAATLHPQLDRLDHSSAEPRHDPHPAHPQRPDLRLLPGGRAAARRRRRSMAVVYRRRRAAAVLAGAGVLTAVLLAVPALGDLVAGPAAPVSPPAAGVASDVHVVEPGDTYWSIAAGLDRGGDIRRTVDELVDVNDGRVLQAGDRIVIPS